MTLDLHRLGIRNIRIPARAHSGGLALDPAIITYYNLRRQSGITIREVARRANVSVSDHHAISHGGNTRITTIRRMLNAIGYDLAVVKMKEELK